MLSILPFLAPPWLRVTRLGLSRRAGIWAALIVSALIFGAAHLPTYDWHWGQALLVIGTARIALSPAYVVTRDLWVSAGAHILNDWDRLPARPRREPRADRRWRPRRAGLETGPRARPEGRTCQSRALPLGRPRLFMRVSGFLAPASGEACCP